MNDVERKSLEIAHAIVQVIELAYNQRQSITWRTVFQFLQYPEDYYKDDPEVDMPIGIESDADLAILKAMITSKLVTKK